MSKIVKRVTALLCVIVLAVSVLAVPASAYASFRTNKGGMLTKAMDNGGSCTVNFSFAGDCIACVSVSAGEDGAPTPSFPKNAVKWKRWTGDLKDSTCTGKLNFNGGSPGIYYYTLSLLDDSRKVLATQTIEISVRG